MTSDERYPYPVVPASEIAEPQAAYLPLEELVYPESDGQPMAETEAHLDEMVDLIQTLRHHFRDQGDVYVAGNLFIYYEQGNPKAVVAPDVFVVHGVPKIATRGGAPEKRRTYKLWEEGRPPSMVIEVTSEHTKSEDTGRKKDKYTRLGVEEYFLWDPFGGYLKPRLKGFRLLSGAYRLMLPTADGSLLSRTTGMTLAVEGDHLRLLVTATGEPLLAPSERADSEAAARREALAEAAAADERAAAADERAAAADERAAASDERAAAEAAARRQAEERAESLRAELARSRGERAQRKPG